MDLKLQGKKAIITGSSNGIGFQIAKVLSNAGVNICINSRNSDSLSNALKDLPGSIGFAADVRDPLQAEELFSFSKKELGRIDILVCNVGNSQSVRPGEENINEWLKMFEYNLFATTNMVEVCKAELIKNKGVIVCISSICGNEVIPSAPITYSTAKAALNFYVKSISRPLGEKGVRINAIAPGNILFQTSVWEKKIEENPSSVYKMLKDNVPLNKFGSKDDIAFMTSFLCSPLSSFLTGSILTVDGGQTRS
tara:strand:- start:156 stop:911 length:756 start_codon:yes stop_codon:yes gene_type:complete